jgi:hypothetical protein
MSDARALAPDMRTTPDFILSQPRLHFAAHIRNVTPNAVSIPVQAGLLERQPTLSEEAFEELRQRNRRRVSFPPSVQGQGCSFKDATGFDARNDLHHHELRPSSSPPDDPSAPSEEW